MKRSKRCTVCQSPKGLRDTIEKYIRAGGMYSKLAKKHCKLYGITSKTLEQRISRHARVCMNVYKRRKPKQQTLIKPNEGYKPSNLDMILTNLDKFKKEKIGTEKTGNSWIFRFHQGYYYAYRQAFMDIYRPLLGRDVLDLFLGEHKEK